MKASKPVDVTFWNTRNFIAGGITATVLLATFYMAYIAMQSGTKGDWSFVGQTLLPLWATWVGTVLAFYFTRENFEAASKSYQDVIQKMSETEKAMSIPVTDAMLPVEEIIFLDYKKEINNKISDILDYDHFISFNRYAVFNDDKTVKYMIDRAAFFYFQAQVGLKKVKLDNDLPNLTLADMETYADDKLKRQMRKGFGFVACNASLKDAKAAMDAIADCHNVFVTQNGLSTESVKGLITNNRFADFIKG
ncbi:MAG: hypothetical protein Q7J34_08385 [Bacteroidales bacterium]|nr:hypothetical protein [Bacteroidales bacterium]